MQPLIKTVGRWDLIVDKSRGTSSLINRDIKACLTVLIAFLRHVGAGRNSVLLLEEALLQTSWAGAYRWGRSPRGSMEEGRYMERPASFLQNKTIGFAHLAAKVHCL